MHRRKSPPPPPDHHLIVPSSAALNARSRPGSQSPRFDLDEMYDQHEEHNHPREDLHQILVHSIKDSSAESPSMADKTRLRIHACSKRERSRCCCMKTRTCLLIVFGLFILLGVMLFLFFPRVPKVNIIKIEYAPKESARQTSGVSKTLTNQDTNQNADLIEIRGNSTTNTTSNITTTTTTPAISNITSMLSEEIGDIGASSLDLNSTWISGTRVQYTSDGYLKVSSDYQLFVFVNSSNYIPWSVKIVLLSAFFPKLGGACIGSGNLTDIVLPSLSSTTLIFPFHFDYYSLYHSTRKDVQDPVLIEILSQCQISEKLRSIMEVQITIPLFTWFGVKPVFTFPVNIPCSISQLGPDTVNIQSIISPFIDVK